MILAKPVIPNQYWILRQHDRKVGNIEAGPGGYSVRINNQVANYKTLRMLKQRVPIDFQTLPEVQPKPEINQVHGYPTNGYPFNAIFDVRHQLPLWTQEERSKSWYAAGWYKVRQHRDWQVMECPKLIVLERYEYRGPFTSEEEANASS